jgi:hypothetical protein
MGQCVPGSIEVAGWLAEKIACSCDSVSVHSRACSPGDLACDSGTRLPTQSENGASGDGLLQEDGGQLQDGCWEASLLQNRRNRTFSHCINTGEGAVPACPRVARSRARH